MSASPQSNQPVPIEGYIPVDNTSLYFREIGEGHPLILLHGGPDFDHSYLLPELDRLSDSFRLIYYDQRGRGKSVERVEPTDVSILSDVADIEKLREHFHLETFAVLGHSWGSLLALEYAVRHPDRVSHLILLNSAPASSNDYKLFRQDRLEKAAADIQQLQARFSDARYLKGDPETVAAYYRIHFKAALRQPEHLDRVIERLRSSFTKEGILKAREIEDRLMLETWLSDEYDLLPKLTQLEIPTLVIHGDSDIVPVDCPAHIYQAIPGARFALMRDCGHFSYIECLDDVYREIALFFDRTD